MAHPPLTDLLRVIVKSKTHRYHTLNLFIDLMIYCVHIEYIPIHLFRNHKKLQILPHNHQIQIFSSVSIITQVAVQCEQEVAKAA